MDYKEFQRIMLESQHWELFFILADTIGFPDGEDIYHTCLLCDYRTPGVNAGEMNKIDDLLTEHVWKKHRSEAEKAVEKYKKTLGTGGHK